MKLAAAPAGCPPHAAAITRRRLLQAAGGTAASIAAWYLSDAQGQTSATLPTRPWAEELVPQVPIQPLPALDPLPGSKAVASEVGRADHQAYERFPPVDLYRVDVKVGSHSFHPDLPAQTIWGYNGQLPGPLFHARYGRPVLVRFYNQLAATLQGYGSPDISVHLHNLHTPSESDGFPVDWWSRTAAGSTLARPGEYKDHHYPMVYAGLDSHGGIGDAREALGTLWYHDHRLDFTASNVYRGMAGFFLAFDDIDSGNEHDDAGQALRLPSGKFDVALVIGMVRLDASGDVVFDQFNPDGFIGNKFVVNGKIQPYMHVQPRKYRIRLLDATTSHVLDLQVRHQNSPVQFQQIANDGNLLEAPLTRSSVQLGVAERADIVVDFSKVPAGAEVFLTNRILQLDGRKPESNFLSTPNQLLKFIVDAALEAPDESRVPASLREQPAIDMSEVKAERTFRFERTNGSWAVNNQLFRNRAAASPRKGTAEIWNLVNNSGGWAHPVHIHFEEGRILSRNGRPPPAHERGRKDVYFLGPNESVRVFLRFRDFTGKYVMHCHNTIHEDHAMMVRWDIVA